MYPKARITRNVQGIKTCIWLNKGTIVDVLQYVGGLRYYLILYNDYQIFIPEDAIEILKYGV